MTGDREKTAKHVADELKLDEVHAELLPGDKVDEVEKLLSAQKMESVLPLSATVSMMHRF